MVAVATRGITRATPFLVLECYLTVLAPPTCSQAVRLKGHEVKGIPTQRCPLQASDSVLKTENIMGQLTEKLALLTDVWKAKLPVSKVSLQAHKVSLIASIGVI